MSKEEIYEAMWKNEGKRVKLKTIDDKEYMGLAYVFESRLDNEDDEGEYAGQGSMFFDPDGEDEDSGMLLYECHIKSIEPI